MVLPIEGLAVTGLAGSERARRHGEWHDDLHSFHNRVTYVDTGEDLAAAYDDALAGDVIEFRGTHILSTGLVWDKNIGLRGFGWDASIIKAASGLDDYVITFAPPTEGITTLFENFKVDGDGANQSSGGCIYAKGAVQSEFRRLHIARPYTNGLYLHEISSGVVGHHNRVNGCLFDNGDVSSDNGRGLIMQASDENVIYACDFESNGGSGSEPQHIKEWAGLNSILNCVFVGGQEGIRLQDNGRSRVIGNVFDGVGRDGVWVEGDESIVQGNYFSVIGGTTADTYSGVKINGKDHCIISGNVFKSHASAGQTRSFIRETTGANWNLIHSNMMVVDGTLGTGYTEIVGANTVETDNIED